MALLCIAINAAILPQTEAGVVIAAKEIVQKTIDLIRELGAVLGLFQKQGNKSLDAEVEELIAKRNKAREEKNWAEADAIRDKLKEMNIILKDTPMGVQWSYGE